jgi:secreted Zn-dependent insulinase-like peptidase
MRALFCVCSATTLAPGAVFPPTALATRVDVLPVTDLHDFTVFFPLPPLRTTDDLRIGAIDIVSSVLGDEGVGSILSYLRAAELGEKLSAGTEVDSTGFALLKVSISLSPVAVSGATRAESPSAIVAALHQLCDRVSGALFGYIQVMLSDRAE